MTSPLAVGTYADHAADTPVRPAVLNVLRTAVEVVGNASAAHAAGQAVRTHVEDARDRVASAIGCRPGEIVFTSGGTEADNLAVKGLVWGAAAAASGRGETPHVVTTAVEHPAVLEPIRWLVERGEVDATFVRPGPDGVVAAADVLAAVTDRTVLVSVMAANNIVGAVNDVAAIGAGLVDHPAKFHVDAVQAMHLAVDVAAWNVDALSLSGHKFGGPTGVGCCVLRRGVAVESVLHGGGQDRGVRSGSMPGWLIAAFGVAVEEAVAGRPAEVATIAAVADLVRDAVGALDGVRLLGPTSAEARLPGIVSLALDGVHPDALLFALDGAGGRASVGAACASGATGGNPVLEAMGAEADSGLRLSFGWSSTAADAARVAEVVTDVVPRLRAAGGGFVG